MVAFRTTRLSYFYGNAYTHFCGLNSTGFAISLSDEWVV
jgi:hypothetical protein